mgnify:CR=1 FL=1
MLGYISIFHLINDALKAELMVLQDPHKYRLLWQKYISTGKSQAGVLNPIRTFDDLKISYPEEVRKDWKALEGVSMKYQMEIPLTFFIQKFPQEHETRFFLCLFWQILEVAFQIIQYAMRTSRLNSKIQYEVMTFMVHLEQWMDDNQSLLQYSSKKKLRFYYQQILAFNWLRTHRTASHYIHPASLRYFEEELEEVITEEGALTALFSYSDQLQPQKEYVKTPTEAPDGNIYDMIDEMSKDIKQLHQVVKRKAEDLQMYDGRFLKPKEVCEMLGITNQTLNNWRKARKFKIFKDLGHRYEYSEIEILEMKKKMQKQSDI